MPSRQQDARHAANHLQVDQSVECMHATAADRCVLSGLTVRTSGRQREQAGEEQGAPFADLSHHRGPRLMQMVMLERFRRGLAVVTGDHRLVWDGP